MSPVSMAMVNRFRRFLVAPRTVGFQIVAVVACGMLALLVPQANYRGWEYYQRLAAHHPLLHRLFTGLQLDHIFSSFWFLALVGMVVLSLATTVWEQAGRHLRWPPEPRWPGGRAWRFSPPCRNPALAARRLTELLAGRGFRLAATGRDETGVVMVLVKNRLSRWGATVFHAGLLLLALAALAGLLFHARGFVQLMAGETLEAGALWQQVDSGPLAAPVRLAYPVRLESFRAEFWPDHSRRRLTSVLTLAPGPGSRRLRLSVSRPKQDQGVTFYQSLEFGYALGFALREPGQTEKRCDFLLKSSSSPAKPLRGRADFPLTDLSLEIQFLPDENGGASPRRHPRVELTVRHPGGPLFQGVLPLGKGVALGNRELYFVAVRPWSGILAVKGYAMPMVFAGFAVAVTGLVLLYLFPLQRLYLRLGKPGPEEAGPWGELLLRPARQGEDGEHPCRRLAAFLANGNHAGD